jgi:hypothetical protein
MAEIKGNAVKLVTAQARAIKFSFKFEWRSCGPVFSISNPTLLLGLNTG